MKSTCLLSLCYALFLSHAHAGPGDTGAAGQQGNFDGSQGQGIPLQAEGDFNVVTFGGSNPLSRFATSERSTLNDLLEELPIYSLNREKQIKRLSSTQEQLFVFEERMRGKGLPQPLRGAFSIYYSAVLAALVEGRITEEQGREYLSVHRQLLDETETWMTQRVRDREFGEEVLRNLHFFLSEMEENAISAYEVSPGLRTPVLNGYQAWIGELLAWGEYRDFANPGLPRLNPGQKARIGVALANLEYFEMLYKRDGQLLQTERDDLHRRLIEMARLTIRELGIR